MEAEEEEREEEAVQEEELRARTGVSG
jgi:hypothetical protein